MLSCAALAQQVSVGQLTRWLRWWCWRWCWRWCWCLCLCASRRAAASAAACSRTFTSTQHTVQRHGQTTIECHGRTGPIVASGHKVRPSTRHSRGELAPRPACFRPAAPLPAPRPVPVARLPPAPAAVFDAGVFRFTVLPVPPFPAAVPAPPPGAVPALAPLPPPPAAFELFALAFPEPVGLLTLGLAAFGTACSG